MTLIDEEYNDEFERNNEKDQVASSEDKEEIIHVDQGLSIVVQRNLRIASEENWLRKNVFHTKCTTKGKVCLVIIDNGSFENVVSLEMVQKLNLKTIPHHSPYKLC